MLPQTARIFDPAVRRKTTGRWRCCNPRRDARDEIPRMDVDREDANFESFRAEHGRRQRCHPQKWASFLYEDDEKEIVNPRPLDHRSRRRSMVVSARRPGDGGNKKDDRDAERNEHERRNHECVNVKYEHDVGRELNTHTSTSPIHKDKRGPQFQRTPLADNVMSNSDVAVLARERTLFARVRRFVDQVPHARVTDDLRHDVRNLLPHCLSNDFLERAFQLTAHLVSDDWQR